jgi:protein required for attachment to host cells
MRIIHDALVLVADGRKSLLLRNEGDVEHLNLVVEGRHGHADLKDREIKTDAPGRAMSQAGGGQSTVDEPDYHQIEEDRFAAETAAWLASKARNGDVEQLIVVAPPHTLGELRHHFDKATERKIIAEVDKDLVNHPIGKLKSVLAAL